MIASPSLSIAIDRGDTSTDVHVLSSGTKEHIFKLLHVILFIVAMHHLKGLDAHWLRLLGGKEVRQDQ